MSELDKTKALYEEMNFLSGIMKELQEELRFIAFDIGSPLEEVSHSHKELRDKGEATFEVEKGVSPKKWWTI